MEFQNKEIMNIILNNLDIIGQGSQGVCYHNKKTKEVYKIFHQALEDYNDDELINYTKDELLRFSNIKNKTFMWAKDTINIQNEVIGYITDYKNAIPLYKKNPLKINLDKIAYCISLARKDIKIISENGVKIYDLMYNLLYGNRFYVTDFDEFSYTEEDPKVLEEINNRNFDYEIYYFLIEGYLDEFIKQYKLLNKLYQEKDTDILLFIKLLKKKLSEYVGCEVKTLNDASKCLNKEKKKELYYQRHII